jgi:hypothetical protein
VIELTAILYREIIEGDFCELMFVGVADYAGDTRQRGDFRGGALRITSGNDDLCERILPLRAADCGTRILIRGIGDGASVQNYQIRFGRWSEGKAPGFELAFESGAVGLSSTASEVFDVIGRHLDHLLTAAWRVISYVVQDWAWRLRHRHS